MPLRGSNSKIMPESTSDADYNDVSKTLPQQNETKVVIIPTDQVQSRKRLIAALMYDKDGNVVGQIVSSHWTNIVIAGFLVLALICIFIMYLVYSNSVDIKSIKQEQKNERIDSHY